MTGFLDRVNEPLRRPLTPRNIATQDGRVIREELDKKGEAKPIGIGTMVLAFSRAFARRRTTPRSKNLKQESKPHSPKKRLNEIYGIHLQVK